MLDYISRILMILPPIVGMLRWEYMDTPIKLFFFLTCFNFFISTSSLIFGLFINVNFLSYINVLGSFFIFILFFRKTIHQSFFIKRLPILIVPLVAYIIYEIKIKNAIFSTGLFIYHNIIVILCSTKLLTQLFNKNVSELRRQPHFWICCSILFFYNCDLILSFFVTNLFDYLFKFFDILFYGIAPIFTLVFTLINAYIFHKTKDWRDNLTSQ